MSSPLKWCEHREIPEWAQIAGRCFCPRSAKTKASKTGLRASLRNGEPALADGRQKRARAEGPRRQAKSASSACAGVPGMRNTSER